MIAAYIRVSTKDQKTDLQHADISAWIKNHGIDEASVRWYKDKISGQQNSRPSLDNLQKDIFSGKIKTVIIWKLDRLSRTKKDGEIILADWCGRGVRVVSITQQLDLSGVIGQVVASVLLGLAEIEYTNIRERQAAGIAAAKKRGVYQGRKAGTTKGKPERAKELRDKGLSIDEIAASMQISPSTVKRYISKTK